MLKEEFQFIIILLNVCSLALGSWSAGHSVSAALPGGGIQRSKTMNDRDFVSLNKAATRKGLYTSQDFSKFRATHNTSKPLIGSKQLERGYNITELCFLLYNHKSKQAKNGQSWRLLKVQNTCRESS